MNPLGPNLDRLLEQSGELYTLPRVAAQVLELTRQPAVNAWELKQCLEHDPALTAKLLRVVNSSLFGLSRTVGDLNQALAILGTKPLKLLVLGFSLPEGLFKGVAGEFLAAYWRRTLIKAVAARELCAHVPRVSGDEAFIAALLQDIGTLVLVQHLGPAYVQLLEAAETDGGDALLLERRTLGFDRTQLSSRLLGHWQLPEAIVAAARLPASPDELESAASRQQPLRQVVYLAELLSRVLLNPKPDALQELLESVRVSTSLTEPQLARLVDNLSEKVAQLAGVLSLELPGELSYGELLARAYAQLAPLAAEAAAELIHARRQAALLQAEQWARSEPSRELQRRASQWTRQVSDPLPAPSGTTPADTRPTVRSANTSAQQDTIGIESNVRLVSSVASAIAACRRRHAPVSLMVVQLDPVEDAARGQADPTDRTARRLFSACQALEHGELRCYQLTGDCVAILLADCERQQAVRLSQPLLDGWRRLAEETSTSGAAGASISIGLAAVSLAPRNFHAEELVASAARCLSGARSSGGNCLKSIEL